MPDFAALIDGSRDRLVTLRHELHAHPEPAFQEKWTAARILTELQSLPGLRIRSGLAGTGILATLNQDRPGPCIALRAELDALPLQEQNSKLPYASGQPGRMHACGHDGHMTCLVGAAMVLSAVADQLPGKVKFIFQPAEEMGGGGARLVEEEGVLDEPKVDAAFALHGWPDVEFGKVLVGKGPILAAATPFEITVRGTGAHAAYPHTGSDVVLASAYIITALQSIASRWDPMDPVLVSVCHLDAGHTWNVLPETCRMKGTVRGLRQASHDAVIERVRRVVESTAEVHGCSASVEFQFGYPSLVNDPTCADMVTEVAAKLLGPDAVLPGPAPSLGGEDFAFFARRVPAALYRLGVSRPDAPVSPALHSPQYDFPDDAIAIGVRLHCEIAYRFLSDPPVWRCG
ncbi:MAG TPA: M20 family metallopeptidase [Phycisphaerae bacterium]|nr:M20 family metallopeptidase [Phycisphaerae bacterium]